MSAARRPHRASRDDVDTWARADALGDLLVRAQQRAPELDGVVFPDGERLSFTRLLERSRTLARGLIGLGIEPRERVGVMMANSPDTVATLFAVWLAGATAVPLNIRYRRAELPFVFADAALKAIVTSDRIDSHVDLAALALSAATPDLCTVVCLGNPKPGTTSEARLVELAGEGFEDELELRRAAVRLRDIAVLLYTSGTTAQPRGCLLTHEALTRNWTTVGEILGVGAGDRVWAPCPLFHLGAIGPLLMCVSAAASFLSDTFFEPVRALDLIVTERANHLYPAYPPITQSLLDTPGFQQADLSSARTILNVAPPETLRQMQQAFPSLTQVSLYGLTEGGGAVTYNSLSEDLRARVETCGLPLPGTEVRIVDPASGADLEPGAEGEILFRGPGRCEGYANDPEKNRIVFDAAGWCHTGDRGTLDDTGRLSFRGRLKEMLKVGGENVAPAEVEAWLMGHPAVKLAQVVGVPDARLEEVPAAFVELRSGYEVSAEELLEHCRSGMARFKLPHYVRFVSDWPMSATKVQKGILRDGLLAELSPSANSPEIAEVPR
jgi:acyl-CoA synthetase (AMP-forming)/AMP-acid ligase II